MFAYYTRSLSITISLFCCLNLLIRASALGSVFKLPIASATIKAASDSQFDLEPMTSLTGEEATSWLKQQGIYNSLQSSIETSRYQMQWADGEYQAVNPAQNLSARFTRTQLRLAASDNQDSQIGMKLTGFGYSQKLHRLAEGQMTSEGNRIEYARRSADGKSSGLVEWYINKAEGLEQGFTINKRPAENRSGDMLTVALETTGIMKLQEDRRGVVFEGKDGKPLLAYSGLNAYDARGEEMSSEVVLAGKELRLEVDDTAAVYPLTIDPTFSQAAKLTANDGVADDNFGYSISISGDTVVVGSPFHNIGANDDQGSAYVFRQNQGGANQWGLVKLLTAPDGVALDTFGYSVSISGDTLVVGAVEHKIGANFGQGSAYVFERNQGGADNWGEVKELTASDGATSDGFGSSIAISGDTIAVGASGKNMNGGSAYVYERNQGGAEQWGEVKELSASDGEANDRFGFSITIDVDSIIVGAILHNVGANKQQGSAYVFGRNQGGAEQWGELKELTASDGAQFDHFGSSVSISGNTAVVGADLDVVGAVKNQGSAYVFERNQGGADQWGEVKHLIASDGATNFSAFFGFSVSISGDTLIVGAPGNDVGTLNQGAAYVFQRDAGGAGNWGEVKELNAADGTADDQLGNSVSISGDSLALGARSDGIGGNNSQGSAYIFVCDCSNPQNNPPQISPSTLSLQQDSSATLQIATVSDDATPAGSIVVTVTSVPPGISVSSITNINGTITAFIAVSCSAGLGANLVGLKATDSDNFFATANLTINVTAETTPPTITCPANVTAVAAQPGDVTAIVTYPPPVATDNCSVPTVACIPPSGSAFPLGTTTVTCTATDAANNTAVCSFLVTVFDVCLQDDSNSNRVLLFNSLTGDYRFCCDGLTFTGKGSAIRKGSICTLTQYAVDRRVQATVDGAMHKGTASLQAPPGSLLCSITDRDTRNNSCACSIP